jgi:hypothetical protein
VYVHTFRQHRDWLNCKNQDHDPETDIHMATKRINQSEPEPDPDPGPHKSNPEPETDTGPHTAILPQQQYCTIYSTARMDGLSIKK